MNIDEKAREERNRNKSHDRINEEEGFTSSKAAREYIKRGWNPVLIPHRKKGPTANDWPNLRITDDNVTESFIPGYKRNIGLQLGQSSHGLTDVDLDCKEAISVARILLPKTKAVFGRKSKPRSHHLYYTDLCTEENTAVFQFRDITREMLVELRIGADNGAQTMAPPSVRPDVDETVEWDDGEIGEPKTVNGQN